MEMEMALLGHFGGGISGLGCVGDSNFGGRLVSVVYLVCGEQFFFFLANGNLIGIYWKPFHIQFHPCLTENFSSS